MVNINSARPSLADNVLLVVWDSRARCLFFNTQRRWIFKRATALPASPLPDTLADTVLVVSRCKEYG